MPAHRPRATDLHGASFAVVTETRLRAHEIASPTVFQSWAITLYNDAAMADSEPSAPDRGRKLLVYRDRIGVPSEIQFSRRQYLGFRTLRPVWTGRVLLPGAGQISSSLIRIGGARGLLFRHFGVAPALDFRGFAPVVHAQFARGGGLALPLARAMDAALVVTLHGGDVSKEKNWHHTLLARRWPDVIARAARFVCVSQAVAEMAARRGAPERLLTVVPIGVEFAAEPPPGPREPVFLFAGRFVEKKGIGTLVQAVRRLRATGDNTKVVFAGDGPLRGVIEALAHDVPGVELTGWLSPPALAARMATALALLVPSVVATDGDAEGLPSVVPEAMALGCAVIGSNAGGIAEAVSDELTGLLTRPGDPDALAAAMRRLSADVTLAERLGGRGFATARELFNAAHQSRVLEAILLEAAERKRRPGDTAV
jgi:colanic acid/amylovoran biosynthesis glycosyltransferase